MSDNEIIKALGCCANGKCGECPLFKEDCGDDIICKNALDLITRQKTEIDENTMLRATLKTAKVEAYKEFAERLKDSFFDNCYESPDVDFDYFVDNLVKEMEGENNA